MRYSATEFFLLVVGAVTTFVVAANAVGYALFFALDCIAVGARRRRSDRASGADRRPS